MDGFRRNHALENYLKQVRLENVMAAKEVNVQLILAKSCIYNIFKVCLRTFGLILFGLFCGLFR